MYCKHLKLSNNKGLIIIKSCIQSNKHNFDPYEFLFEHLKQVGVTTQELDDAVHQAIIDHGAYPSPLNYKGFPKSVCTSVNNVTVHGIPNRYE